MQHDHDHIGERAISGFYRSQAGKANQGTGRVSRSESRHGCTIVRGRIPFACNPVLISIKPVVVSRVSPQDGLRVGLAREVWAVVAVALADVLRGIKAVARGRSARLPILVGAFSFHSPCPRFVCVTGANIGSGAASLNYIMRIGRTMTATFSPGDSRVVCAEVTAIDVECRRGAAECKFLWRVDELR